MWIRDGNDTLFYFEMVIDRRFSAGWHDTAHKIALSVSSRFYSDCSYVTANVTFTLVLFWRRGLFIRDHSPVTQYLKGGGRVLPVVVLLFNL